MNVFEDLIGELKQENLLEETVIDVSSYAAANPRVQSQQIEDAGEMLAVPEAFEDNTAPGEPGNDTEFYRKRAVEEVSSIQMVEHVLSAIEREYKKAEPTPYDDLETKKALHRFLQIAESPSSPEYVEAEYALMRETGAWFTALAERDLKIDVSSLRLFCENSRPVLSSQALIALARFYRNSPFSEDVRAKFDFVMTRLFSRDNETGRRRLLFNRQDALGHIKTFYANWSSISLFAPADEDEEIAGLAARFYEIAATAERAQLFEELVSDDFFAKIHLEKESAQEMFFVPEVIAAAIECNVRVGNRFVELLQVEREKGNADAIAEKCGYENDQVMSFAAGMTVNVAEMLSAEEQLFDDEPADEAMTSAIPMPATKAAASKPAFADQPGTMFAVNKWLLAATIIVAIVSGAIYFMSDNVISEPTSIVVAKTIDISSTDLKMHLRTARATGSTLYGVALPTFDSLDEAKQKEFLKQMHEFASQHGLKKVQLMNVKGRTIGFASEKRVELVIQ